NHTLLSLLSLGVLLLVTACGGDNGNYNNNKTNGNSGNVGVNGNAKFSGNIIFVKSRNMFILHGKDNSLTQLTSDSTTLEPSISPDNSTIAFEVRKSGSDYSDIATMSVTGGAITKRTDDSLHNKSTGAPYHYLFWANNPIWTSDGKNL